MRCRDERVERAFDGEGRIEEMTWAELSALRMNQGSRLSCLSGEERRMPLFSEYLAVCRYWGGAPFIELKTPDAEHVLRTGDAVQSVTRKRELGLDYAPSNYMHMPLHEINRQLWAYLDRDEITRERLFEVYPFFESPEQVAPWFLDQLAQAHDPQEGAAYLLCQIRDAGVRVFTASSGIGEVMNGRVERAGLSGYLTGRLAADDVGAMKPSRQYFDTVFRRSGETDLSRTLMVGDNPVTDVRGAVDYGMTGALFGARWQEKSRATYVAHTMQELENMLFEEET